MQLLSMTRFWTKVGLVYGTCCGCCQSGESRIILCQTNEELDKYPDMLNCYSLLCRFLLDVCVNVGALFVILFCVPIQVSGDADALDFTLNVVAAFFIIELDDSEPKTFLIKTDTHERNRSKCYVGCCDGCCTCCTNLSQEACGAIYEFFCPLWRRPKPWGPTELLAEA